MVAKRHIAQPLIYLMVVSVSNLLPKNANQFERDLEDTTARIDEVPITIRDSWNAEDCPVELLPWLAWAFSLDSWQGYWTEDVKRQRIRDAIAIQQKKGTKKSILDVIEAYGAEAQLTESFDPVVSGQVLAPRQFAVDLNINSVGVQNSSFTADLFDAVRTFKRCGSYFELRQLIEIGGGNIGDESRSGIGFVGRTRVIKFVRLEA